MPYNFGRILIGRPRLHSMQRGKNEDHVSGRSILCHRTVSLELSLEVSENDLRTMIFKQCLNSHFLACILVLFYVTLFTDFCIARQIQICNFN